MRAVAVRCNPERLRVLCCFADGEIVKYLGRIAPDSVLIGDKTQIGILLRGFFVVVARANLRGVADISFCILARNQTQLACTL